MQGVALRGAGTKERKRGSDGSGGGGNCCCWRISFLMNSRRWWAIWGQTARMTKQLRKLANTSATQASQVRFHRKYGKVSWRLHPLYETCRHTDYKLIHKKMDAQFAWGIAAGVSRWALVRTQSSNNLSFCCF
jgi:hypothetical protein